jgi:hypothetical protein
MRNVNPFLGLAGIAVLLYVGFNGAVALLPYSWTHDYDGLNALGAWIGIAGAIILSGLALAGAEKLYGEDGDNKDGPP